MFNAEKLLGGLLMGGSRQRGGLGSLVSGGAALGLVGIAMEAVEHYMNQSKTSGTGQQPPAPPPGQAASSPPPPPSPGAPSTPPPPPGMSTTTEPSKTMPDIDDAEDDQDTVLLIRAMIAAANADGVIDQDERARILGKIETMNLSDQEHSFIVRELLSPVPMEKIVASVKTRKTARQVYTVSILAIDIDTDAEREYITTLAKKLNLDQSDTKNIHEQLGIENPASISV